MLKRWRDRTRYFDYPMVPRTGRTLILSWFASMLAVAAIAAGLTYHWAHPAAGKRARHIGADAVVRAEQSKSPSQNSAESKADRSTQTAANTSRAEGGDNVAHGEVLTAIRMDGPLGLAAKPDRLDDAPQGPDVAVADWCDELAGRLGSIGRSQCLTDGFRDTGHRSVEGRPMVMREVPASTQPATGRVLLLSAVHGDEPSSIATVFSWMKFMARNGTSYNWNVVPTFNPDGVLDTPSTRVNANGVDLNRNLPTVGWAKESRDYWRRVGYEKRRFPGDAPGSEPENQWLVDEIHDYQPDVIVTLHAPYGVLDYDGDFPAPQSLGNLHLHRLGVYPGSLGNFASRMQGIPVITIELDDARDPPDSEEMHQMWHDLNDWLDRYLRSVRQASSGETGDAG